MCTSHLLTLKFYCLNLLWPRCWKLCLQSEHCRQKQMQIFAWRHMVIKSWRGEKAVIIIKVLLSAFYFIYFKTNTHTLICLMIFASMCKINEQAVQFVDMCLGNTNYIFLDNLIRRSPHWPYSASNRNKLQVLSEDFREKFAVMKTTMWRFSCFSLTSKIVGFALTPNVL